MGSPSRPAPCKDLVSNSVADAITGITNQLMAVSAEVGSEYISAAYVREKTDAIRGWLLQIESIVSTIADDAETQ